jgi:hypothetical protein
VKEIHFRRLKCRGPTASRGAGGAVGAEDEGCVSEGMSAPAGVSVPGDASTRAVVFVPDGVPVLTA